MSRCRGLEKNVKEPDTEQHTAAAGLSLGYRVKPDEGDQGSHRNKGLVQTNIGMDGNAGKLHCAGGTELS